MTQQAPPVCETPTSIKRDDLVQARVSAHEIGQFPVDHPRNVAVRKAVSQQMEDRQRLDDITERTGLDHANASHVKLRQALLQEVGIHATYQPEIGWFKSR